MLVVVAAAAVAVLILIKLYVVVVPVVLALFLASVLEPLAARLRRHRWPAALAAITVFVGALAVVLAALVWIGASVASQFGDLGEQIDTAVDDAKEWAQASPSTGRRRRSTSWNPPCGRPCAGRRAGSPSRPRARPGWQARSWGESSCCCSPSSS